MTYSTDIDTLSPGHRWKLSSNTLDAIGSADGVNTAMGYSGPGLCRDASISVRCGAFTDKITLPNSATINNSAQTRKIVCGWYMVDAVQPHPCRIYGEGTNTTAFHFVLAQGNNVMLEVIEPTNFTIQVYGITLVPNRAYHLCGVFEGNGFGNIVKFYIDGVEQTTVAVADRQPNTADLDIRGFGYFADSAGTVGVGGGVVILQAAIRGTYNQWATWDSVSLSDADIREVLFEKGAIPTTTITNQAGLDALADTVRGNDPLSIYVDVAGSISLTADNVTFDPLCSIHVQYGGTGTLTWTNTNGSNATIGSVNNGGTLNFVNPATLTIEGVINGAEVRIYDNEIADNGNNNTELDGIESNSGTSFTFLHPGATNDIVVQMMADGYEEVTQTFTLSATDQTLTLFPVIEENI